MSTNNYKNIKLINKIDIANCITHSGKFHIDDVFSTIFLGKMFDGIILCRIASTENENLENKLVYDIGGR